MKNDNQKLTMRRLQYFKFAYPLSVVMLGFYFYLYNFNYQISSYNIVLLPLMAVIMFSPLIYIFTKKYMPMAITFLLATTVSVTFLIYTAGGMDAPGIFWIAGYPILAGVLAGKKGVYFGVIFVIGAVVMFLMLDSYGLIPTTISSITNYHAEKVQNLITFFIFVFAIMIFYVKTEEHFIDELRRKHNQTDTLVRIIYHDIASPLTIVKNRTSQLLKIEEFKDNKNLNQIMKTVNSINELLYQVREIKTMEDGISDMKLTPVIVSEVVTESVELVRQKLEAKGIKVNFEDTDDKVEILADKILLRNNVFMNILTNAIKFSHENGQIDIQMSKLDGKLFLLFRDYGIGMPKDLANKIFKVGEKTSRRGTSGESGTGFGMPIVKEFVDVFDGTIYVDSVEKNESGEITGTTMTMIFPIHKAAVGGEVINFEIENKDKIAG